jgi:copper chaperone
MFELKVDGMTCQGCVDAVTNAVDRAVPGAKVDVDLDSGLVRIDGAPQREPVASAIEDAGFDVVG